jgi:hypothetical protein
MLLHAVRVSRAVVVVAFGRQSFLRQRPIIATTRAGRAVGRPLVRRRKPSCDHAVFLRLHQGRLRGKGDVQLEARQVTHQIAILLSTSAVLYTFPAETLLKTML